MVYGPRQSIPTDKYKKSKSTRKSGRRRKTRPGFWLVDLFKTPSENNRDLKKKVYRDYGVKFRSAKQAARYLWNRTRINLNEIAIEKPMEPPKGTIFFAELIPIENKDL